MMTAARISLVFAAAVTLLSAAQTNVQPYIWYRGVVNAASLEGQGLPAGSIAQGSIFTIFGSNLGPEKATLATKTFPLPSSLADVSIDVVVNGVTLAAIPLSVQASSINAIMPSKTPAGQALVVVHANGKVSNSAKVNVVAASSGLFSVNNLVFGPSMAQNQASSGNAPMNTTRASARPGQTVTLMGTGLGAVPYADNVQPKTANLATVVEAFVGNQPATVHYSGRASCCAGLDEITFTVPANAATGCYVPVQVRTAKTVVSNAATIAINKSGAACADQYNPVGAALLEGGRYGIVTAQRFSVLDNLDSNPPGQITTDYLFAGLQQDPGGTAFFNPSYSLPPLGTCTMYSISAFDGLTSLMLYAPQSQALDAGTALQVAAGGTQATVGRVPGIPQIYGNLLGEQPAAPGVPTPLYAIPGSYTLTIPGGADVHSAQVTGSFPAPLQWTNENSLSVVNRANPLTVTWTGGNSARDVVFVGVLSNNDPANSSAAALCVAPVSAGKFTVPVEILQSLPATPASATRVPAWLLVTSVPLQTPTQFQATGLETGYLVPAAPAVKTILVQ